MAVNTIVQQVEDNTALQVGDNTALAFLIMPCDTWVNTVTPDTTFDKQDDAETLWNKQDDADSVTWTNQNNC